MKYKYLVAGTLVAGCAFLGSCKDDFAEINTNPTVVSEPDPRFLFTQALANFDGHDYFTWFYDYNNLQKWSQTMAPTAGNSNLMTTMSNSGNMGSQVYDVMNLVNELDYVVEQMEDETEKATYTYLRALCKPLMIYLALWDTDMSGDMAYTEAYQARYKPELLTPKYDTQEELYKLWEDQLKEVVKVLNNPVMLNGAEVEQRNLGSQDLIYKGDYTKWAKFANSVRLKLAARLINVDRPRALAIVKDVSAYPIMGGTEGTTDDDFIYNKSYDDRHMPGGNDMSNRGAGSQQLISFLVNHRDPRVRFFFEKNDYNGVVVQAFLDKEQRLPSFIADYVETSADGKTFTGWKAPGEPWVRYVGLPTEVDASILESHPEYADYYDTAGKLWKVSDKSGTYEATYYPYSQISEYMFDKKVIIDFPVAPGAAKDQIQDLFAWYGLYLSAAEVNLYLAEFKLLSQGQDIGFTESAQNYLNKGVKLSVEAYDNLAKLNKVPYYDYLPSNNKTLDKSIKLESGEVTTLLNDNIVKLDGDLTQNLEKVYLQQYIHFVFFPADQYVMMRRSGCPMKNSTLYPMKDLYPGVSSFPLPRRFQVTEPTVDDKMGDIKREAYQRQGFSYGPEPAILNTERVWVDKNNPEFGAGPKIQ